MTPYELGLKNGTWTLEQVYQCGFSSVQACLEHQERVLQEEWADLAGLSPEYATRQAQYLEGLLVATRASLRALL